MKEYFTHESGGTARNDAFISLHQLEPAVLLPVSAIWRNYTLLIPVAQNHDFPPKCQSFVYFLNQYGHKNLRNNEIKKICHCYGCVCVFVCGFRSPPSSREASYVGSVRNATAVSRTLSSLYESK